jgi:FkbM family methyltransferase
LYYGLRKPAVWFPASFEGQGCFYVLSGMKLFSAPSRKQGMALLRSMGNEEVQLYYQIFKSLNISHDNIIVDIGANIGYSTLAFQRAFSILNQDHLDKKKNGKNFLRKGRSELSASPKFILVEPNPKNFQFIYFNLRMINNKKWLLLPFGLGKETKICTAGIDIGYSTRGSKIFSNSGLMSFHNKVGFEPNSTSELLLVNGETFLNLIKDEANQVRFCKIDTEGMELEILEMLESWFVLGKTIFQIEVNPLYTDQSFKESILNLCSRNNYCILVEEDAGFTGSMERYLVPLSLQKKLTDDSELVRLLDPDSFFKPIVTI